MMHRKDTLKLRVWQGPLPIHKCPRWFGPPHYGLAHAPPALRERPQHRLTPIRLNWWHTSSMSALSLTLFEPLAPQANLHHRVQDDRTL